MFEDKLERRHFIFSAGRNFEDKYPQKRRNGRNHNFINVKRLRKIGYINDKDIHSIYSLDAHILQSYHGVTFATSILVLYI